MILGSLYDDSPWLHFHATMVTTASGGLKMDLTKTSIKNYWNWRSGSFGHDADKSENIAGRWESIVNKIVSKAPGKRVLDIGTGTGQLAVYLARGGFEVTGIDIAENMVTRAKEYAESQGLDIDFRTGDAEDLAFGNNTFDAIVSRNTLWTLPHPEKALREWRRVLKPGGLLMISDGQWMNTTWKRIHHLAIRLFKGMGRKNGMVSFRFFCTYAGLQKTLPFYEGICFEKARMLLQDARFQDIQSYQSHCLDFQPYGARQGTGKGPSFFIAGARR